MNNNDYFKKHTFPSFITYTGVVIETIVASTLTTVYSQTVVNIN